MMFGEKAAPPERSASTGRTRTVHADGTLPSHEPPGPPGPPGAPGERVRRMSEAGAAAHRRDVAATKARVAELDARAAADAAASAAATEEERRRAETTRLAAEAAKREEEEAEEAEYVIKAKYAIKGINPEGLRIHTARDLQTDPPPPRTKMLSEVKKVVRDWGLNEEDRAANLKGVNKKFLVLLVMELRKLRYSVTFDASTHATREASRNVLTRVLFPDMAQTTEVITKHPFMATDGKRYRPTDVGVAVQALNGNWYRAEPVATAATVAKPKKARDRAPSDMEL